MNMNTDPIYDYKCSNNIVEQNNAIIREANIKVYNKNNKLIYEEKTKFSFNTNEYGQEVVTVFWNMSDGIMRAVDLRGIYNPAFQNFSFSNDTLRIEDIGKKIQIHISSIC